jgi:hypothetical protein
MEEFVPDKQDEKYDEEELRTRPGDTFEIEDYVAGEKSAEGKLHCPREIRLHPANPSRRRESDTPSDRAEAHEGEREQIAEKDNVIDYAVDPGHREGIPDKADCKYYDGNVLLVFLIEACEPGDFQKPGGWPVGSGLLAVRLRRRISISKI